MCDTAGETRFQAMAYRKLIFKRAQFLPGTEDMYNGRVVEEERLCLDIKQGRIHRSSKFSYRNVL